MSRSRRRFLTGLGVFAAGCLAGCNGDDSQSDGEDTPTHGATATPTATPAESAGPPKLAAADGGMSDRFGEAVAISADGTTALVGALRDDEPNGDDAGSAYVFTSDGDGWSQQAKLAADDGNAKDRFGVSVSLSADGTVALIGALRADDAEGMEVGAAYVFERSDGSWSQATKLPRQDDEFIGFFGNSVDLSGDGTRALVGMTDADPGAAHLFSRSDSGWAPAARLAPDDQDADDDVGDSVALSRDGKTALVTAPIDEDPNGPSSGSVSVFTETDEAWSQERKFTPDDGDEGDTFGTSLDLSQDATTALVGAPGDEDPNGSAAGSAYVFSATDGEWRQQAKLAADDGDDDDWFGSAVGLAGDGSTAVVGAPNDEDPNGTTDSRRGGAGSAYLFSGANGAWNQQRKLAPADGDPDDNFGNAVALPDTPSPALVAASGDDEPSGTYAGSVYVYDL